MGSTSSRWPAGSPGVKPDTLILAADARPCDDLSVPLSTLVDVDMTEEWASLLSDRVIRRTVGAETCRRGAAYVSQGRVSSLKINYIHRTLFATVSGNRPTGYQTFVTAGPGAAEGVTWSGRCTCPMVTDCKHVAAVLLASRGSTLEASVAKAGPSWEQTIADVVRTPAAGRDDAGTPLALQLEVVTPPQPRKSVV